MLPPSFGSVRVKTGFDTNEKSQPQLPDGDGIVRIAIPEVNRVEIDLGEEPEAAASKPGRILGYAGYMVIGKNSRPLPIGSTLDRRTGRFSWMPGPGFLGAYDLVFVASGAANPPRLFRIRVEITPKR